MKVLVDTNVLLDVLAQREPLYGDSARVWALAESGRITAFVSALSLPNVYCVLRRAGGWQSARRGVKLVRDVFAVVSLDEQACTKAIDSDISDFEDAIQFSALRAGATALITRNPKDFPSQDIAVQTPSEFLATHFSE